MTLIKVGDIKPPCLHSEHNPPSMIVLQPGTYQHTCPGCGHVTTFSVYPGAQCVTTPSTTSSPNARL